MRTGFFEFTADSICFRCLPCFFRPLPAYSEPVCAERCFTVYSGFVYGLLPVKALRI